MTAACSVMMMDGWGWWGLPLVPLLWDALWGDKHIVDALAQPHRASKKSVPLSHSGMCTDTWSVQNVQMNWVKGCCNSCHRYQGNDRCLVMQISAVYLWVGSLCHHSYLRTPAYVSNFQWVSIKKKPNGPKHPMPIHGLSNTTHLPNMLHTTHSSSGIQLSRLV